MSFPYAMLCDAHAHADAGRTVKQTRLEQTRLKQTRLKQTRLKQTRLRHAARARAL